MKLTGLDGYVLRPPVEAFPIGQGMNSRTVGVHTGGGDFLWKRYQPIHAEASIRYEHRLLDWLATRELSFAVPSPVPDGKGDTLRATDDGLHALFPLIPGSPPDYAHPLQLENVGAGLAELQAALASYPTAPRTEMSGCNVLGSVHSAIFHPHTLSAAELGLPGREPFVSLLAWWREEVAAVQGFIDGTFQTLPRQVIHGDFAPVNTLHLEERLTAIVDFEFAGPDVRAVDVASGLYFSLRVWQGDDPWLRGDAFGRGYFNSRNQARLTDAERSVLPWLMRLRNTVSKIFWLGKSLADGTMEKQVVGIGELESFNCWLVANGERLINVFGEQDADSR